MARSTVITSIFVTGSAPRRRLNQFIYPQIARISGDRDVDTDAICQIEGAINFAVAGGLFGSTKDAAKARACKFRKELNGILDQKFKGTELERDHLRLDEE